VAYATGVVVFIQLHSTDFILFRLISLLLHNFHCTQVFFAGGVILLVIELAPAMEDEDEAVYRLAEVVLSRSAIPFDFKKHISNIVIELPTGVECHVLVLESWSIDWGRFYTSLGTVKTHRSDGFGATVCKTVRLCYRTVVCLSCLSVCDVGVL